MSIVSKFIGGGGSTPSLDTAALEKIRADAEAKKRGVITGLRPSLNPVYQNFQTQRGTLSSNIPTDTEKVIGQYGQDLQGVNASEAAANTNAGANFKEQQFRNVPELQRSIRESLGGTGLLNNGAAASILARPTIDAARASRDFSSGLDTSHLQNVANRQESVANTGVNARSNALQTKLGLDKDTIDYLTSTGREDLVNEANNLLGVEDQAGADKLGIEQARQSNEMAKAAAANSRRGQILTTLGSLGGAGLGALTGNPMAIGLGSQLGGTVGNIAGGGGGGGGFDPTLLYAMAARQPANRTAVVRALGNGNQRVNIGTGAY